MTPGKFKESNIAFKAPPDIGTCEDIQGWSGQIRGGEYDGMQLSIVAWKPDDLDKARIAKGGLIYLSVFGGMIVHNLATEIQVSIEQ